MSELGLKRHTSEKKGNACSVWARKARAQLKIDEHNERIRTIRETKFKDLGPLKNVPRYKPRPRGKPLSIDEKMMLLKFVDKNIEDFKYLKNGQTEVIFLMFFQTFIVFSLLGILCLLIFEWIRNALLFLACHFFIPILVILFMFV